MKPIAKVSARKYKGAGDVVQAIAKPIAKVIDAIVGTNLKTCSACERRRKALNRAMPFR
jgi:hypothetical protein